MHKLASDIETLILQKLNELTTAKAWILCVQLVNMLHELLFILPLLLVFGVLLINIGTIQVYELTLATDRELILRICHIPGWAVHHARARKQS